MYLIIIEYLLTSIDTNGKMEYLTRRNLLTKSIVGQHINFEAA